MTQITIEVTEEDYRGLLQVNRERPFITGTCRYKLMKAYEAKKKEEPQAEPIPRYEYVGAVDYKTKYLELLDLQERTMKHCLSLTESNGKLMDNYNKLADKYINKGEK